MFARMVKEEVTMPTENKPGPREVIVYTDDGKGSVQPKTFQMCGLGLQFYSDRLINEFELMEFDLKVDENPASPENVHCTGAVVRCQEVNHNSGKYRVWLKFIDTPDATCKQIACVARKGKHLCSFCENF